MSTCSREKIWASKQSSDEISVVREINISLTVLEYPVQFRNIIQVYSMSILKTITQKKGKKEKRSKMECAKKKFVYDTSIQTRPKEMREELSRDNLLYQHKSTDLRIE